MVLRVGTDCSGIEAPIQALRNLKIQFRHVFSCEKDKFARMSIAANYKPEMIYEDITTRNHSELPDIDLYVCGFPCQSFSLAGKQQGMKDPRGLIMNHCIEVIKVKQPTIFILENVKNFKFIDKGKPFKYLMDKLNDISTYNIYYDIYNTKDYGIPQNRERIYIIGILKTKQKKEYVKPKHKKCKSIDNFILDNTVYNREYPDFVNKIIKNYTSSIYLDKYMYIFSQRGLISSDNNLVPTLPTNIKHYILNTNRYLNTKEALLLQGFPKSFKQVVSNTQFKKQIGNSMSVNVIQSILKQVLSTY